MNLDFGSFSCSPGKPETGKKQEVMTLSDSDDVQTISSGSDDNKEKEKVITGKHNRAATSHLCSHTFVTVLTLRSLVVPQV